MHGRSINDGATGELCPGPSTEGQLESKRTCTDLVLSRLRLGCEAERFKSLPPLLIAIGYEIIFQEPVTEIFAGLRYAVNQAIEHRLETFEARLREKSVHGFRLKTHNRKLEWLEERKSAINSNSR